MERHLQKVFHLRLSGRLPEEMDKEGNRELSFVPSVHRIQVHVALWSRIKGRAVFEIEMGDALL